MARYFKTVSVELAANGREYKLQNDVSITSATIVSVRTRSKGYTLNGQKIASEVFDSALLKLKIDASDRVENLPLAIIDDMHKANGKGFELNMKNIDWTGSVLTIQNPAAAVAGTAIELIFEYEK